MYARYVCSSSLWKVMVKFSSGGAMVELFLKLPDYVPGEVSSSDDEDSDDALTDTRIRNKAGSLFGCCSVWLLVLCLLIKGHPSSLASVTITNSKKEERLYVSDMNLLVWKNKSKEAEPDSLNQTLAWMCTLDGGDIVTWEYTWDEKDLRDPLLEFLGLVEVKTVGEDVHHHGPSGVDASELDLIASLA
ncbi:hypothetical protein SASPL_131200 [Salvia splendens]|uniref:Uncharacterized protein n=1 Tax=Salvia splendens TaxID=180675 RepID=A0A8X8XAI3_SALSN|nr:hypothetical protein SASPL_131200 [Salvia splendens]